MGWSVLIFGFLVGLKHALEADHVAAVASLAARFRGRSAMLRVGLLWGTGHGLTLLGVGAVLLSLGGLIPENVARILETVVGGMLVLLGLDLLRRLARERVHFHIHRHADGQAHLHAHSHAGQSGHGSHRHAHPVGTQFRVLLVGLMHGLAGSAALVLLTAQTAPGFAEGMVYLLLFALGSSLGMVLLTLAISVPLSLSARHLTRVHSLLMAGVGVMTCLLGASIVVKHVFGWT